MKEILRVHVVYGEFVRITQHVPFLLTLLGMLPDGGKMLAIKLTLSKITGSGR